MMTENKLVYEVMSRVKTVRGVRAFAASPWAGGVCAVALVSCASIIVSVRDVMTNTMAHVDWSERFFYAYSALIHSRIIVQALALLIILACTMVAVNSLRRLRFHFFSAIIGVNE